MSYSSRESHVQVLLPSLWIAFSPHFEMRLTPSALESGADQLDQINKMIGGCSFAVAVLDGLRANVAHEIGILSTLGKPVILLKEKNAVVDIKNLVGKTVDLSVSEPTLNLDTHFSNIKNINHAPWDKLDSAATVRTLLQEYRKKQAKIPDYVEIEDPKLWLL